MTPKRFIAIDDGFDFMVRDTFTGDNLIDAEGVEDVLNDYEKENEQLKKTISMYSDATKSDMREIKELMQDIEEIQKENEELKQEIETLQEEFR